jgi:hypothetical protein
MASVIAAEIDERLACAMIVDEYGAVDLREYLKRTSRADDGRWVTR